MKIDLDYYARIANGNEFDPIILRSELNDLVKEVRTFLSKIPSEPTGETDTKKRNPIKDMPFTINPGTNHEFTINKRR